MQMKKRVAVLHAQIPFIRGGAEIMVEKLVEQLKKFGFEAELIKIPFKWYPENSFYDSMLMWNMLDLEEINGKKIDLVIGTKFPSYGVKHSNKVIWLMHQHRAAYDLCDNEGYGGFNMIQNGIRMKNVVKHFDNIHINEAKHVYCISKNVSKRLKEYNSINADVLYHPPGLEGQYKCKSYGDYILSVGRLDQLKRIDLLLEAVAKTGKEIKVKIAGEGSEMEKLQNLTKRLHLSEQVEFLGFVSDERLIDLYANALAVYFAPVDEDYGYITLEAFLSKKTVITCKDSGGVLEFANKENSVICDSNSESISFAIKKLYDNREMCKALGENGYDSVKDIAWKNVIETLTSTI